MEKHFTVTVYIVAKIDGQKKILLHSHKKLQMWLGIGGHIEENEDPIEALIREVKEETQLEVELINLDQNLFKSKFVKQLIVPEVIMEEQVPAEPHKKSHIHIDLIYFAKTKHPEKVKMAEKFGWFSEEELSDLDLKADVLMLAKKAFQLGKVV